MQNQKGYPKKVQSVFQNNINQYAAKEFCTSKGLVIARIDNHDENTALEEAVKTADCNQRLTWIGLERESPTSEVFRWSDGSIPTFTNWRIREPNNKGGIEGNTTIGLGGMYNTDVTKWYDLNYNAPTLQWEIRNNLKFCVACYKIEKQDPEIIAAEEKLKKKIEELIAAEEKQKNAQEETKKEKETLKKAQEDTKEAQQALKKISEENKSPIMKTQNLFTLDKEDQDDSQQTDHWKMKFGTVGIDGSQNRSSSFSMSNIVLQSVLFIASVFAIYQVVVKCLSFNQFKVQSQDKLVLDVKTEMTED